MNEVKMSETNMTVDLSTLKVGDTVTLRNGTVHKVFMLNPVFDAIYSHVVNHGYHRIDGGYLADGVSDNDIVEIIPQFVTPTTTEALRFNEGKTPYAYLPLDLLDGAARAMQYGAKKYGDNQNFRKGYQDLLSPLHSIIRHTVELQRAINTEDVDGEKGYLLDKESGEAHIHHLVTSAMMLIHSMRLKGYRV